MKPPLILITGLAGAGKSTALRALEDAGFYCIDNLPVRLLDNLLASEPPVEDERLAVVMDLRDPAFGETALRAVNARMVFLEADDGALIQRFQEGRRRHRLAAGGRISDGIAAERRLLAPVRAMAHHVLDTSGLSPHQLKQMVLSLVGGATELQVWITSFGFKKGPPPEADMVLDVRFLPNPYFEEELRERTGREAEVADYVLESAQARRFLELLLPLLAWLIPQYRQEGKSYFTLAIGCTGGRHRSVAVVERLAALLGGQGLAARIFHRELPENESGDR